MNVIIEIYAKNTRRKVYSHFNFFVIVFNNKLISNNELIVKLIIFNNDIYHLVISCFWYFVILVLNDKY